MTSPRALFLAAPVLLLAAPLSAQNEYLEQIELQIETTDELMDDEGFYPIVEMLS